MIELEDLPAFIHLLDVAFGYSQRVGITEEKIREISLCNCEFSMYYAGYQVIAVNVDWNTSTLQNDLGKGPTQEMNNVCSHSHMAEHLMPVVTLYEHEILRSAHSKSTWVYRICRMFSQW
jgi:hypothetical protein